VRKDGGFYRFTLRLVPAFPFFLINLAMGLTPIGTRRFYWVSQLGMLLGTAVYVNGGTRLAGIPTLADVASPGLLVSSAGLVHAAGPVPAAREEAHRRLPGYELRITFDALLIAVGRAARLQGFGLEELGVACGKTVSTNGFLQTTIPDSQPRRRPGPGLLGRVERLWPLGLGMEGRDRPPLRAALQGLTAGMQTLLTHMWLCHFV
jgi:hypothetical protein